MFDGFLSTLLVFMFHFWRRKWKTNFVFEGFLFQRRTWLTFPFYLFQWGVPNHDPVVYILNWQQQSLCKMKGKLNHTPRGFGGAEIWSCFCITKALILIVSSMYLLSQQVVSPGCSHSTDNALWFWFYLLTLKSRHQDISTFLQILPFSLTVKKERCLILQL